MTDDHQHTYSDLTLEPVIKVEIVRDVLNNHSPLSILKDQRLHNAIIGYRCIYRQCTALDPRWYLPLAEAVGKYKELFDTNGYCAKCGCNYLSWEEHSNSVIHQELNPAPKATDSEASTDVNAHTKPKSKLAKEG